MQTIKLGEKQRQSSYQFGWFDRFCLWYPPAWLVLFNRHWQHYKPDPNGWRWSEYILFLLPGGFYIAIALRWLRLRLRRLLQTLNWVQPTREAVQTDTAPDLEYQQAFRNEILAPIVQRYFQAELHGLSNLPPTEPLLITLNHAGMCFPWDFLCLAWLVGEQRNWFVQPLAHPLFFDHPWLKWWLPDGWAEARGGVRAEMASFDAAVAQESVVIYAPEGWRGLAKGWQQRYQLAKFDPSFVRLSLQYHIPILPVICLGSERLHPLAFNVRWLARWVQMPMFPISPLIPLFALFPSMGVWAARSRLQYYLQPLWQPWDDATIASTSTLKRTQVHQLTQALRSRLQSVICTLVPLHPKN
ncbi:MAG: 1-acyl-sn-glycerol-3-phosphate acyltransferase [Leptolyngbyaceae cyanobacterium bins.302]|nr:1-acyl-sn-glycerol-3-phosphate acyltransferase [Leptolyngbyaceae cyanobacterium bins.302]